MKREINITVDIVCAFVFLFFHMIKQIFTTLYRYKCVVNIHLLGKRKPENSNSLLDNTVYDSALLYERCTKIKI